MFTEMFTLSSFHCINCIGIMQGSLKTRIDLLYSSSPLAYIKLIKNKNNFGFSKRAIFGEKLYQGNYFVVTWQSIRSLQWSLGTLCRMFISAMPSYEKETETETLREREVRKRLRHGLETKEKSESVCCWLILHPLKRAQSNRKTLAHCNHHFIYHENFIDLSFRESKYIYLLSIEWSTDL